MLGVIADDLTGATDIADVLVERGFRTIVMPFDMSAAQPRAAEQPAAPADALVVALKSRSAPVADAVAASLRALTFLRESGCDRFYFKYCSTFDSTPTGNIGPVIDSLLEALDARATIVTPANPRNERTVYQGHLFVGDALLNESGMENHPLNPMTDSDIRRLLAPQTDVHVEWVGLARLRSGRSAARDAFAEAIQRHDPSGKAAIVVDAIEEKDLTTIVEATQHWPLLTGSAGLARGLCGPRRLSVRVMRSVPGKRVILCGSASLATMAQVEWAKARMPWVEIDSRTLMAEPGFELERLRAWAISQPEGGGPVLIVAPDPRHSARKDAGKSAEIGAAIESVLAGLAVALTLAGFTQILVAGGETSGAVVERLGVGSLSIGPVLAEGVAWTLAVTADGRTLNLALKSGNFGQEDLFESAWRVIDAETRY